jgi:hypothetical protein
MDRRQWIKNVGLILGGGIAVEQLELLEKLKWTRKIFPSIPIQDKYKLLTTYESGFLITQAMVEDDMYIWSNLETIEAFRRMKFPITNLELVRRLEEPQSKHHSLT